MLFTPTYESAGKGADGKPLCNAMVAMFTDAPGSFSGNTRAPGFVPSDFTPAPADLASRWPHRADLIAALIRPAG